MCLGSKPKAPDAPAPPPPPPAPAPQAARPVTQSETGGRDQERRRKAGRAGTILTGGQGILDNASTGKTVLGG